MGRTSFALVKTVYPAGRGNGNLVVRTVWLGAVFSADKTSDRSLCFTFYLYNCGHIPRVDRQPWALLSALLFTTISISTQTMPRASMNDASRRQTPLLWYYCCRLVEVTLYWKPSVPTHKRMLRWHDGGNPELPPSLPLSPCDFTGGLLVKERIE